MATAQGAGYNFVSFKELMSTANITPQIVLGWYNRLKKYDDWNFKDNNWYAIVDDCPFEILKDTMELTTTKGQEDLKVIAYEKTQLEEFLPQAAKDLYNLV